MTEAFKKKLLFTLLAIGIFLAISLIFSYPALQGNVLNQGDNVSWKAMSWEAREHYEKTGETPLWTNSMFGGMPTYTHYMAGVPQAMYSVQDVFQKVLPKPAYFFFFAMLGFFILLSAMRVHKWVSISGAIAYAFAAYNLQIIAAGHDTKMITIAFMPIAIAGMIWLYRGNYWSGAMATLAGLSLSIQNHMFQVDYYLLIMMVLLGVGFFVKAILDKKIKPFFIATAIVIFCGVLSLLPNILSVALTKEYGKYTMRGGQSELTITNKVKKENGGLDKDYAFSWSQGVGETFTLFIPNLYGAGAGQGLYWGDQPFLAGPYYFGILTMLFLFLGIFLLKNRLKWVLLGIGIFGIFLALGRNFSSFNYLLFDHLPMYNSFRTPNMSMVIPGLTFMLLAFWTLNEFFGNNYTSDEKWKALKMSSIIVGALVILLGFGSSLFLDFKSSNDEQLKGQIAQQYKQQGAAEGQIQQGVQNFYNDIVSQRASVVQEDGIRSLLFLLAGVVILFLFVKGKMKSTQAMLILCLVFVVDLVAIGQRYLNDENYQAEDEYNAQFAPSPVDLAIKQDPDPYYRVYDISKNVYNDATQAIHHKCIGGYHPAKLESYQDLIDVHLTPGVKMNQQVLNMLNTKYIIYNGGNQLAYQPNPGACGNAWFVDSIKLVKTADQEMEAMNAEPLGDTSGTRTGFKPLQYALVRESLWKNTQRAFSKSADAQIKLSEYGLNRLTFSSSNASDGFAVFSDIYYPLGWKAFVDDKETEIIKTNYLLRGIVVPKGNHTIRFEFVPATLTSLKPISVASSYLILFLLLGGAAFLLKKEWSNKEEEGVLQPSLATNTEAETNEVPSAAVTPKVKKKK